MAKYTKENRPPPTPKSPKPWDPPPLALDSGDVSASVTYEAVGRALSQWEKFESELAALFAVFVGGHPTSVPPAIRAYGSIQTFRGRADMIEAAAEAFFAIFPNPQLDLETRASKFMVRARGWSSRRNEIAHGVVWEPHFANGKKGAALFPSRYATSKNKMMADKTLNPATWSHQSPVYAYTSAHLKAFEVAFMGLEDDVNSLWFEASAWREGRMADARDREAKRKS